MQENIEKENSVLVEKQRAIEEQQRQHSLNEKENHRLRAELTKFKEEPERIRKNISRYGTVHLHTRAFCRVYLLARFCVRDCVRDWVRVSVTACLPLCASVC